MTREEQVHVAVTARILSAARGIQWLAIGLTVVAGAAIVEGHSLIPAAAAMVLGLVAVYYGIRVSLDARLFEDAAADRFTASEIDLALGTGTPTGGERDWIDRCRGARRLIVRLTVAALAQMAALVLLRWT